MTNDLQEWVQLNGLDAATSTFPVLGAVGSEKIWVFKTKDGFRGVQEKCPHQNVQLGNAIILGNGSMIRCVLHGFTFKMKDGAPVNCKGYELKVYDVRAEGHALFARQANPAAT